MKKRKYENKPEKMKTCSATSVTSRLVGERQMRVGYIHPKNRLPKEVVAHHRALDAAVMAAVKAREET